MQITFDKYSLMLDDKRIFIKSAALHYFRTPGEQLWKDRLTKLKAAGYNTVDLYFCWNYHSQKQGQYDFSDIKDINKLLKIAQDMGMFVIARPGPFINAEITAGGFPYWLLENKNIILRNRQDGDFIYSLEYMQAVKEWYEQIIPILNNYDNIIAFQIENEYSSNEEETQYLEELYQMARNLGIKAPIFHNDAYCAGLYADLVDIYACDIYPYINPDTDWKQNPYCFDNLDNLENNVRSFKENAPVFIAEMQSGWFDKYNGKGYEHIKQALGREHINIMTKTAISQGVTMFNHYMGCGGTNWGEMGCDETYTSYDFAAPVSEEGLLGANYFKAKEINYFLDAFDFTNTEMIAENELFNNLQENIYAKVRKSKTNGEKWLFVRNLNNKSQLIEFKNYAPIELPPFDMRILPVELSLKACKIDFSAIEIFAKVENSDKETIFMIANDGFVEVSGFEKFEADSNIEIEKLPNKIRLKVSKELNLAKIKFFKGEKLTELVFLDQGTADKTWIIDNKVFIGADLLTDEGQLGFKKSTMLLEYDINAEQELKKTNVDFEMPVQKIELKNWEVKNAAPEIDTDFDYSNWRDIKNAYDCASNGVFDEFVFYKGKINKGTKEIKLSAQRAFCVFINGIAAFGNDNACMEKSFKLDEILLTEEENELTILVQHLGFDKGFCNDVNLPRGLISIETTPKQDLKLKIRGKLSAESDNFKISQNSYVQKISADFECKKLADIYSPISLSVANAEFENITIILNGYKVGRYIKARTPQTHFYLPETFLKEKNSIELIVCYGLCKTLAGHDFNSNIKNVNINIEMYNQFKLYHF